MRFSDNRSVQLAALVGLLGGIGVYSLREKFSVIDFDTWWHLKVGDWILQNAGLPHTGILSRTAVHLPWVAYSWGYEVLLSVFYSWFGLVGIGILGTLLTIGVTWAIYWMLRRVSRRFWSAWILTGVTCAAFLFNGAPRPVFFSYILFCFVLALLFEAQRSARIQTLYWLPLIFLLWANLHIQFIYGLFTVGLFVAINVAQQASAKLNFAPTYFMPSSLPAGRLMLILAACFAATLVGPNFYHPYLVVLAYTKAKFSYKVILELQPLPFRYFSNFIELFLAAAGFYAVGWNKRIDLFKLALLVVASIVAFRTMRDAWFICFSAAACIADFPAPAHAQHQTDSWHEVAFVTVAVAALLLLAAPLVNFNARALDRAISADYPVNAVNFLRRSGFSGPLYNNLNWGGFLMWYLPELPVVVDGRNDLYGDELDELFYNSQSAMPSYKTDRYLDEAGVVILESKLPLAQILTIDPRFRLVYHDDIATVYTRQ
ncbi:MAG TPA: hypothetical protein VMH20_00260 [Verrucomicrobiae bacterium]|nr:hypothetical protein [Verrucomicrobiae bacterium]